MNNVFKYGSISDIPMYNCSGRTSAEWTLTGESNLFWGFCQLAFGILVVAIYIPMITVMLEKEVFKFSCYKIMTFLLIIDSFALIVCAVITGILSIKGAVYCTFPVFIYISGMASLGLWACSCITAMVLVINRLLDMTWKSVGAIFFDGNRTFLVLILPVLYGMYFVVFTKPCLYNSKIISWAMDPFIFNDDRYEYFNYSHFVNNIFVGAATCCLYVVFCFVLGLKVKNTKTGSTAHTMSTQIFLQSAMICAFNQISAVIYVFMNFIDVPFWLIVLGHFCWQLGHGAPAFIYLRFNKTIRNGILKKFGLKTKLRVNNSQLNGLPANGKQTVMSVVQ